MLRFLRPNLGMALLAGRVALAFAASPFVLAHEAHPHAQPPAASDEAAFMNENEAAMNKMMAAMDVKPGGDIDRDFVAMMAPHHQGAIDMAVIELRYGKNETLRRLAQEIIVDQMQEIDAMKLAIGDKVSTSAPAPTQGAPAQHAEEQHHMDMHMDMSPGMKK
jgi:Domain of unknown function (DUF305)